ncbi:MAG: ParB N-terminal domain-containing protein [Candidatus Hadarchaeales archaeon]
MAFKLRVGGIEIGLEILSVGEMLIHEEIIPEMLEDLISDIKNTGKFRDPVIVDSETKVVLDGMHRVAAAKKLGLNGIPACLVDYGDPKIKVGCWYRVIDGCDEEKFLRMAKLFGLAIATANVELALRKLEERDATAAFLTHRSCHLVKAGRTDIFESYTWVKRIERAMKEEKCSIRYEIEEKALKEVSTGTAVLMVPCVTKEEVKRIALSGRLFSHKTTRHVIPARPVNVAVPVEWLDGRISIGEANLKLEEYLSKRGFSTLPAGGVFDGRIYEEELVIFR